MKAMAALFLAAICVAPSPGASEPPAAIDAATAVLVTNFMQAWSNADAAALARLFAADGDLITPDGTRSRGRAEIESFYAGAFARGYKGSQGQGRIAYVRLVAPDTALIDATWSITGAHRANGAPSAPETGTLASVMGYRDGRWQILAIRESTSATRFVPLAERTR